MSETILWTNSAPTSNFTAQIITMSNNINNYKYVKITYRLSTTNSTEMSNICSVEDFKKTNNAVGVPSVQTLIGAFNGSATYARAFRYKTDTTAEITAAARLQSNETSNNVAIPLQIIGLS